MPFPYGNNELTGVDLFLFNTLTANAALVALLAVQPPLQTNPLVLAPPAVFSGEALQGAVDPLIIFDLLSSPDRNVIGNDARAFTRPLYIVRAYNAGTSYSVPGAIAKLIDATLLGARGNVVGENLAIMGTFREEPVRGIEVFQGVRHAYVGGRYRMFVTAPN